MKNIFIKVKEFCRNHKKRIIKIISSSIAAVIIVGGTAAGVVYSKAKGNLKYTQEQLQKIALGKIPGEVVKVEKELNFEEAVYEYEFSIKDKENMLQKVKLDSQSGAILRENNEKSNGENKDSHDKEESRHGED
ncbi:PepSY domain-containing protein [Clostridium sp. YIM B02551]|uniref:PepSY domain-containing protein n=1 Tax=Clostridium sp. YIM B02551 TaxID=2910679 RepID=UPI001EEBDC12|nr:PepSY domain-containing protein [Clostridium sp. YIM B02551]